MEAPYLTKRGRNDDIIVALPTFLGPMVPVSLLKEL